MKNRTRQLIKEAAVIITRYKSIVNQFRDVDQDNIQQRNVAREELSLVKESIFVYMMKTLNTVEQYENACRTRDIR